MVKPVNDGSIGRAHSKLILIGEHAVVYNEPAIALPFDAVSVMAKIRRKAGNIQFNSRFYKGDLEDMPEKMQGLVTCVKGVCKKLKKKAVDFDIDLESTIPIGRGLGSSAAIAVALVRGLYKYFQVELQRETLMDFVDLAEQHAHGTPSGIDREATSREHPIWFVKDQPVDIVKIKQPLHLIVADTGRIGDTHSAVDSVKALYQTDHLNTRKRIEALGTLTKKARESMESGDLIKLGETLNQAHFELKALGVSDPGLDHYVEVSQASGALGAKLTGGGRGGCMIALADSIDNAREIEKALQSAGASETWYCQITNEVMDFESQSTRTH
ncbi:mevalonate kinase [Pelagirhabdus alkalitolerans]|uniref:mevalonate kinase n=1 Tax=Pelagirhabdus alkalitolerans TaxID=1612202 RepID=A0A1G6JQE4_9BACI|nr:mevalonate kinase [Pelagirhabdus alkalitolerans]SDC20970.1 mevalonate kinase [Pelagirhabdus alkalitolerans]